MPKKPTTADVQDAIIVALSKGNYRQTAAQAAGISRRTLYNWMKKGQANLDAVDAGREDLNEWGLFLQEIEQAEAKAQVTMVTDVIDAAKRLNKPELILKFLAMRWPKEFGRRQLEIVRSTAEVAAEAEEKRRSLREQIAERKARLAERQVH